MSTAFPEREEEANSRPPGENFIDVALQKSVGGRIKTPPFIKPHADLENFIPQMKVEPLLVHVGLMEANLVLLPVFLPFSKRHDLVRLLCQHAGDVRLSSAAGGQQQRVEEVKDSGMSTDDAHIRWR